MSTDKPQPSGSEPNMPISAGGSSDDEVNTYRLTIPSPMVIDPDAPPLLNPARSTAKKVVKKSRVSGFWILWAYNALVFVTSVCVMVLELTASRLIAKTVGSSLYTWTSVIGVVLAGITLGNFLGGWLADRYDRQKALAWTYLFGSVSCASVLWLDQIMAPMSRPAYLSWPTWVLTVVAAMFLLPSLALGTISPLVASMALARSSRLGATVGNVYAWGALGSIVGTFLTGFYLMDVWGTRTIIGLTAATLGVLAIIVGGAPRLFRTAVICGWMQLLGWVVLAATCTEQAMAYVSETAGAMTTVMQSQQQAAETRSQWEQFGTTLGTRLHELGLALKLRDDQVGAYYDESNYSTIMVTEGKHRGRPIKHLRLDKLIHSYYDASNPTALHYEYEQIYAAVTKRTAHLLTQPVSLSTKAIPSERIDPGQLPAGTSFDPATATLRVNQPSPEVFDALLSLAPEAAYWQAIDKLYQETNKPLWGGFASTEYSQTSDEIAVPEDLQSKIRIDQTLQVITAYEVVTPEMRDRLVEATPTAAWFQEVQRARGLSQRATAMFMGGGGYIFPRWFLKEFPGSPRIEVAELDPAVYQATIECLGLTAVQQSRILTTIGDARNLIDDRLRDNRDLAANGKAPIRYDFIYSDAFNDFSVPAHLTTLEFLQKLHDLLNDEGVFQGNIIDIYPRTEYPGTTKGEGEISYHGPLPIGLAGRDWSPGRYEQAGGRFAPLEIKSFGNNEYWLRAKQTIGAVDQARMTNVDLAKEPSGPAIKPRPPNAPDWSQVIESLAAQTRQQKWFEGAVPSVIVATEGLLEAWTPAKDPWQFVEYCRLGNNGQSSRYVLGFRGIVSAKQESQLIELDRNNRDWVSAVGDASRRTRQPGAGRFLGRYVKTATAVFPNVYLFSTSGAQPGSDRDTFVMVCSRRPLDLKRLGDTGDWSSDWFAAFEKGTVDAKSKLMGQMDAVLSLAEGQILTDDFAPVDNLLRPVFADQQ
jgi:predicted membrane-bound spermidine synthase